MSSLQRIKPIGHKYVKFIIVGGSGALLQLSLVYLLTEKAGFYYMLSLGVAILIVSVWNFTLNYKWTFTESREVKWLSGFLQSCLCRLRR